MAETKSIAVVSPPATSGTYSKEQHDSKLRNGQTTISPPSAGGMPTATTPHMALDKPSNTAATTPQFHSGFQFPTTLPTPPFINLSGVPNFRCLGGYLSANGKSVLRPNYLYRCAHPTEITQEGLSHLTSTLGVKAIYDLRSKPEVARTNASVVAAADAVARQQVLNGADSTSILHPPEVPSQSALFQSLRHFTPVYATQDTGPEALARKLSWYSSPDGAKNALPYQYSEGFVNAYRGVAIHGTEAYITIFRHILTRPHDPFVFHCTAGKDRTGVFAALVCRLAGIDDETICWEYAITEPGLGEWRKLFISRMSNGAGVQDVASSGAQHPQWAQNEKNEPDSFQSADMTREEAARVCGSRAGNMRAWLTLVLDGEFGGVERYLVEKCEFSEEEVTTMKRNLLVDAKVVEEGTIVRPCGIDGWTADGGCEDI